MRLQHLLSSHIVLRRNYGIVAGLTIITLYVLIEGSCKLTSYQQHGNEASGRYKLVDAIGINAY